MSNIKTLVRSTYDLQNIRIQMGNRIAGQFKAKLGQKPAMSEDDLEEDAKQVLDLLRVSYKRITDGVIKLDQKFSKQFTGDGVIDTYTELVLVAQYLEIEEAEKRQFKHFKNILDTYPIYSEWLSKVKGVGPAMAGVIISEFDIAKSKYPSSMWRYAGLDVKADGRGASRRSEHLVDVEYTAADGTQKIRKSLGYNPFLKTKLMGVLAGSFLRAGENPYRTIYDNYKHRLENHPAWIEKTKGHRHNAAMRYMIKMFLADLYRAWRTIEGLPVAPTYQEAKLGHIHGEAA